MKIIKYSEFIKEEFNSTPEEYIEMALKKIKTKIERMFEPEEGEEDFFACFFDKEKLADSLFRQSDRVVKIEDVIKKDDEEKKITFKDLGLRLESSEISKYSELYDSVTIKFSDDYSTYNLWIMIELKEGMPKDTNGDFSNKDVKKCYVKFKKYDNITFDLIGQIDKNVDIDKIDEDFLVDLKIEIDEEYGTDGEELEINK